MHNETPVRIGDYVRFKTNTFGSVCKWGRVVAISHFKREKKSWPCNKFRFFVQGDFGAIAIDRSQIRSIDKRRYKKPERTWKV